MHLNVTPVALFVDQSTTVLPKSPHSVIPFAISLPSHSHPADEHKSRHRQRASLSADLVPTFSPFRAPLCSSPPSSARFVFRPGFQPHLLPHHNDRTGVYLIMSSFYPEKWPHNPSRCTTRSVCFYLTGRTPTFSTLLLSLPSTLGSPSASFRPSGFKGAYLIAFFMAINGLTIPCLMPPGTLVLNFLPLTQFVPYFPRASPRPILSINSTSKIHEGLLKLRTHISRWRPLGSGPILPPPQLIDPLVNTLYALDTPTFISYHNVASDLE